MSASTSTRSDITYRRAFRWRLLSLASGGLLAATFFMPAVDGCNSAIVPAEEAWTIGSELSRTIGNADLFDTLERLTAIFFVYSAGYLFGLLVASTALGRLTGSRRLQSVTRVCFILFTLTLGGGMCAFTSYLLWEAGWSAVGNLFIPGDPFGYWIPLINLVLMPLWLLALLIRWWRRQNAPELSVAFVTGLFAIHWFSYWSIASWWGGDDHYGIHLSLGASCVIVLAVLGDARAVSGLSWLRTTGRLMTGRFRDQHEHVGMCPLCGYNLYGLTEQRCPECGREFTFEEVGASAEVLGFVNKAAAPPAVHGMPMDSISTEAAAHGHKKTGRFGARA